MQINKEILFAVAVVAVLVLCGTLFFSKYEEWTYTDSFYFSTMTLTTIGYGDLVPTNNVTKIAASVYSIIGVGAVLYLLGSVIGGYLVSKEKALEKLFIRWHDYRATHKKHKIAKKKK